MGHAKPKRGGGKLVLAILLPVVLIAGVVGGVLVVRGWSGGGGTDLAKSAELSDQPEIPFPDPQKLGFTTLSGTDAGAVMKSADEFREKTCKTIGKTMDARGYDLAAADGRSNGGNCAFFTPGISFLEDGSLELLADVAIWKGEAETKYDAFVEAAETTMEKRAGKPNYKMSKPETFPAGEAGFIQYTASADASGKHLSSHADAYFRSGDYLMYVGVRGSVHHPAPGQDTTALSKQVTYDEITAIVTALGGGEAGKPQITQPKLKQYAGVGDLGTPKLPVLDGSKVEAVCAKLAPAFDAAGLSLGESDADARAYGLFYTCTSEQDDPRDPDLSITVHRYNETAKSRPGGELGRDVRALLSRSVGGKESYVEPADAPLYALPAGDSGYLHFYPVSENFVVHAGYLSGDDVYVEFELSNFGASQAEMAKMLTAFVKGLP